MEENRLDKVIENAIKNASMEAEVRQPVMERIAAYEMKAAKRPRIIVILYFYALAASLVFLVLSHKLSQHVTSLLKRFPAGVSVSMMEFEIRGIFIFMIAFLLVMGLYYWQNARKKLLRGKAVS